MYTRFLLLLSTATSHDFKWFSLAEMRWGIVFPWWGMVLLYPEIRVIPLYVEHWLLLFVSVTVGDQSVQTLIKTLTISKYFVGSGANPMHTHVVWKSLRQRLSTVKGRLPLDMVKVVGYFQAFPHDVSVHWICTGSDKIFAKCQCLDHCPNSLVPQQRSTGV